MKKVLALLVAFGLAVVIGCGQPAKTSPKAATPSKAPMATPKDTAGEKPVDPKDKPVDPKDKPADPKDKPADPKDKPADPKDKPDEKKDKDGK